MTALVGRAPPPRLDLLVNDIEAAIVSGDRASQSALVMRSADALTRRWSRLPPADKPGFDRLLAGLLEQVDDDARAAFARHLTPLRRAPRVTATRLASDPSAQVAVPLLEGCPSFDDAWLLDLMESLGEPHLQAIARRPCVSEAVGAALIRAGHAGVTATLLANPGATLRPDHLAALVPQAAFSKPIALALAMRGDLPQAERATLVAMARKRALAGLAEAGIADRSETESLLQTVVRAFETTVAPERSARFAGASEIVDRIAGSSPIAATRIERWVAQRRVEDALAALARDAGLPIGVLLACYDAPAPDALAAILRGLDHPWSLLKALLRSRGSEEPAPEVLAAAHRIHTALSARTARRLARYAAVRIGLSAFVSAAVMDDEAGDGEPTGPAATAGPRRGRPHG